MDVVLNSHSRLEASVNHDNPLLAHDKILVHIGLCLVTTDLECFLIAYRRRNFGDIRAQPLQSRSTIF